MMSNDLGKGFFVKANILLFVVVMNANAEASLFVREDSFPYDHFHKADWGIRY
jgi:hypothetical protein